MRYDYKKTTGGAFSPEAFKSPDVDFYPAYSWSWGSPLDKEKLKELLDEYCNNGIKRMYVLPMPKEFRPWTKNNLQPDYLTPEYFEMYKFAYEYAESLGMKLWIYDEGGWPSGGACGQLIKKKPHLAYKTLAKRDVRSPYKRGEGAVAAFCDGVRIDEGFSSDKTIEEYYFKVIDEHYPNICDKETTEAFIELTHEGYKKYIGNMFGRGVDAAFTDEPVCDIFAWGDGFEEKFFERYGYSVLDVIPTVLRKEDEDFTPEEEKVRCDYFDLLAEEFCNNFFITLRDWCRENNLISAGHLNTDDVSWDPRQRFYHRMRHLRAFDMPGIDVIWRQIFPNKKNHFFPRFASSAANQIGSLNALSESYAIYGAGITFDVMRYVLLYQMARGINVINIMQSSYGYEGVQRRNGRPGFDKYHPTWQHLKYFNRFSARMSYLMTLGISGTDTAVYFPQEEIWCGGEKLKSAVEAFDEAVYKLEALRCPTDIIDGDFLETAYVENGAICTGNAKYRRIVIPEGIEIENRYRDIIDRFKKDGGEVVYADELGEDIAEVGITSDKISLYKRISDGDVLYLMQNEDAESVTFSVEFADSRNVYELDCETGDIYEAECENITWCSGEGRVYLLTDKTYSAKQREKFTKSITLSDFEVKRLWQFKITDGNFEKRELDDEFAKASTGDFKSLFGEDFSGVATFKVEFELDEIPEVVEIDLGAVKYSCDVELNGQKIADMCFSPFKCTAYGECIKKHNVMLITVANTPANEFVTTSAFENLTPEEIGPYHERAIAFEKESVGGGLSSQIVIKY